MSSATHFRAGSSTLAVPVDIALLQQPKPIVSDAIREVELTLMVELEVSTKKQIALQNKFRMTTTEHVIQHLVIEKKLSILRDSIPQIAPI